MKLSDLGTTTDYQNTLDKFPEWVDKLENKFDARFQPTGSLRINRIERTVWLAIANWVAGSQTISSVMVEFLCAHACT